MTQETVTLTLPRALLKQAQLLARAQEVSVGELVRQLLTQEVQVHCRSTPRQKTSVQHEDLKHRLAPLVQDSADWGIFCAKLAALGYVLRAHGSGLAIYSGKTGRFACNTAAIGYRYRKLIAHFGAPWPGHPHAAQSTGTASEDACEVIEHF